MAVNDIIDCRHRLMTAGTDERIDIENSGHCTAPVTLIQAGSMARGIVEHVEITFEEGFGDRLGSKAGG